MVVRIFTQDFWQPSINSFHPEGFAIRKSLCPLVTGPYIPDLPVGALRAIGNIVLNQTIESFRLDQRAWITVDRLHLENQPIVGRPITVLGLFKNTGKTPARNEMLFWGIDIRSSPPPKEIAYSKIYKPIRVIIPSGPLRALSISTKQLTTQELLGSINRGELTIYVYGLIEYRDVFDRPHTTEFCGSYGSDRRNEGDVILRACTDHNEIR